MTELETQLLNTLKRLEKQFSEQQSASEKALESLKNMFEHTSEENRVLAKQVQRLNAQVQSLSKKLERVSKR